MAKSFKTVYFDSELLIEWEKTKIDLNLLCNEALRMSLNKNSSTSDELDKAMQLSKDNQLMIRLAMKRSSMQGMKQWSQAVPMYAKKYNLSVEDVIRKFQ